LDPATLRPRGGRVNLGEFHEAWSFAPRDERLALGIGGATRGIHIIDLAGMRESKVLDVGAAATLGWLEAPRIAAVLQSGQAVVVDPDTGRTLYSHTIDRFDGVCSRSGADGAAAAGRGLELQQGWPCVRPGARAGVRGLSHQ